MEIEDAVDTDAAETPNGGSEKEEAPAEGRNGPRGGAWGRSGTVDAAAENACCCGPPLWA